MTYMILDSYGNAVDSFKSFTEAANLLKKIVEDYNGSKDELVIIEYNKKGHAINACKYEDLSEVNYG